MPGPRRGGRRSRAQLTPAAGGAAVRGAADRRRSPAAAARRERGCRGNGDEGGAAGRAWAGGTRPPPCSGTGERNGRGRDWNRSRAAAETRTRVTGDSNLGPPVGGGGTGSRGTPGAAARSPLHYCTPPPPRARGAGRDWLRSICHAAIGWRGGRAVRDVSARRCAAGGHL